MALSSFVVVSVFVAFNSVFADSCGGLLEGEHGRFNLSNISKHEQPETPQSACLWIVQLHYETNVRFTLDALSEDAVLNLYPEDQLTSCSSSYYTKLNSTQVGSSFEFLGKTLIVVLPNSSASVSFSWHFIDHEDKNSSVAIMKNSDYIVSPNGFLEWGQLESVERVTWGINPNENFNVRWDVDVATSCDATDNCACFYFAIFHLTSEGALSEALRTCGQSSEGQLKGISGRVVVVIRVNTKVEANQVAVSWELNDVTVTEPPATSATGLFAATAAGLIALNLQTVEATTLTSGITSAVAVNHNLQKVYWSENGGNSSILCSNFDGSDKEVIVPPTGDWIYMLAIDEASGNIYFALHGSHEITVCNALGLNCAAVISDSSFVKYPLSIALDSQNGVMYWAKREPVPSVLVRANMDGSNARVISTAFTRLNDIVLCRPSNDVLYWADYGENAIGTIDINGENKRTLLELEGNPQPWGIQVDAQKIYIGNWNTRNIQSVDRDSGKELTTVFNTTGGVYFLALFNAPVNQS